MKKLMSLIMALALALTMTAPCLAEGEPDRVIMTYLTLGVTPADLEMVESALNEKTIPDINVNVELKPVSAYDAFALFPTWLGTGERVDLMMPLLQSLTTYVDMGLVLPLTKLISENAPYIQTMTDAGWTFASGNRLNGEIYAVAGVPNLSGMGGGFVIKTKYLDELDITIDKTAVYTLDDLTEIFEGIKELHPEMYPCAVVTSARSETEFNYATGVYDKAGAASYTGAVMGTDSDVFVNLYDTEEYLDYIRHIRDWYLKGYIHPDAATTDATNVALVNSGVSAGYLMVSAPVQADDTQTIIRLSELYVGSSGQGGWVVPCTAGAPEAAVKLLDYIWQKPEIANLIQWGIEGVHYVMKDESIGLIAFPDGVDATTSGYYNTLGLYGDTRKIYIWNESVSQADNDAYSEEAIRNATQIIGFLYQPSEDAAAIMTGLSTIVAQYIPALESGSVDIETLYPQFIKALEDAGIDAVIAEKQAAFEDWRD